MKGNIVIGLVLGFLGPKCVFAAVPCSLPELYPSAHFGIMNLQPQNWKPGDRVDIQITSKISEDEESGLISTFIYISETEDFILLKDEIFSEFLPWNQTLFVTFPKSRIEKLPIVTDEKGAPINWSNDPIIFDTCAVVKSEEIVREGGTIKYQNIVGKTADAHFEFQIWYSQDPRPLVKAVEGHSIQFSNLFADLKGESELKGISVFVNRFTTIQQK
ncbi:MAG TPA: hypothetical protein VJL87_02865 [Bdellovibrionota bacterium]|nr:hypothetical protein [Bdellovibrionota bacterium]